MRSNEPSTEQITELHQMLSSQLSGGLLAKLKSFKSAGFSIILLSDNGTLVLKRTWMGRGAGTATIRMLPHGACVTGVGPNLEALLRTRLASDVYISIELTEAYSQKLWLGHPSPPSPSRWSLAGQALRSARDGLTSYLSRKLSSMTGRVTSSIPRRMKNGTRSVSSSFRSTTPSSSKSQLATKTELEKSLRTLR